MRPPLPDSDARRWAAAWRAFADDDAAASAPTEIEWRVLQAARRVHGARQPESRHRSRRWLLAAAGTAASLMLVAAGFLGPPPGIVRSTAGNPGNPASPGVAHQVSSPPMGAAPAERAPGFEPAAGDAPPAPTSRATDPAYDTETVQLVRIRVPVGALLALGVTTIDPDASGVVDVDVTVGDDGLAREIRGIRAVPYAELE